MLIRRLLLSMSNGERKPYDKIDSQWNLFDKLMQRNLGRRRCPHCKPFLNVTRYATYEDTELYRKEIIFMHFR